MRQDGSPRFPGRIAAGRALLALAALAEFEAPAAAGSLSGTVFGPGGSPVAGVNVTLLNGVPLTTLTNGLGQYTFQDPSSFCYSIKASSPSFGAYYLGDTILEKDRVVFDFVSTMDVTGKDFHAEFGHSIGGAVNVLTQNPSGKIRVGLVSAQGNRTAVEYDVNEGNPGEYPVILNNVPEGDWIVYASLSEGSGRTFNGDTGSFFDATVTHLGATNVTGIVINLPATPEVVATVRDENGDPLQNQAVAVYEIAFSSASGLDYTDQNGEVRIPMPGLAPGSQVLINSYGTSFQPFFGNRAGTLDTLTEPSVLSAGDNLVNLVVPAAQGSVSSHVAEAGTATAIPFAPVALVPAVENGRLNLYPWQKNASFLADWSINAGVPKDWYSLTATGPATPADFHVPKASPVFLVGSGNVARNLDLQVGGRANVTVQGSGSPVIGARVRVFDDSCEWVATGFTNFGGLYPTPNLTPGDYIACADANGFEKRCSGGALACQGATPFSIGASAITNTQVTVVPRTERRVSGTLKDGAGNPIPFAGMAASGSFAEFLFFPAETVITDPCGDFSFAGPPGTTFALAFFDPERGFVVASGVIGNSDQQLDLTLTPWPSAVWGRVTDDENNPLQGVRLSLDTELHSAESDQAGYYRLGAQPGTHRLWATGKLGYDRKVYSGLQIGASPLRQDVPLDDVPADSYEANDFATSLALTQGVRYERSFSSAEDVDWQSFNAQEGLYYRFRFIGELIDEARFSPTVALFDDATRTLDRAGARGLIEGTFTPKVSGTYRVGASWSFAGGYGIELTSSATPPGPPTPTVSSISPTSGPAAGGTTVTLTGTNFVAGTTVKFGTQNAGSVVIVNATTITCKSPALAAAALYDVTVTTPAAAVVVGLASPHAPNAAATLTKGWFTDFTDVPLAHTYHLAIEKVLRAGITTGCDAVLGKYCPNDFVTRGQMAVFILRGKKGGGHLPPDPKGTVFSDVKTTTQFARWIEEFYQEGITTGCQTPPLPALPLYCPTATVTRDGMAKFLLLGKNGSTFDPGTATGTVFEDVKVNTLLAKWMERLKTDGITSGCGPGAILPKYCPGGTVTRGEMAKFLRIAFGL